MKAYLKSVDKNKLASKRISSHLSSTQDNNSGGDSTAPLLPPKPPREQAKALYQYKAQNEDELTFKEGDIITIINKDIEDKGWWKGELNGRIGVFPDNFIELIKPQISSPENDANFTSHRKRYDEKYLTHNKPVPPPPGKLTTTGSTTGSPLAKSESKGDVASNNTYSSKAASLSAKISSASESSSSIEDDSKMISSPLFGKKSKFTSGNSVINFVKSSSLSSSKPDVVPQESSLASTSKDKGGDGDMDEVRNSNDLSLSYSESSSSGDINLGSLDLCGKLTHLTVNRARAPRDRRPPSVIGVLRDSESEDSKPLQQPQQQNGDVKSDFVKSETKTDGKSTSPLTSSTSGSNIAGEGKGNTNTPVPPWMVELRKNQAERRYKTDSSASDDGKEGKISTPVSPTKANPARFSSDFSFKQQQQQQQQQPSSLSSSSSLSSPTITPASQISAISSDNISTATNVQSSAPSSFSSSTISSSPMSIVKPARATKPNSSNSTNIPSPHVSPHTGTPPKSASASNFSSIGPATSGHVSLTKVQSDTVVAATSNLSKELADMQAALKNIRKSMISRDEYDDLVKKVIIYTFFSFLLLFFASLHALTCHSSNHKPTTIIILVFLTMHCFQGFSYKYSPFNPLLTQT